MATTIPRSATETAPPPILATTPNAYPWADGVRGIAALTVAMTHAVNLSYRPGTVPLPLQAFQMLGGLMVPIFIWLSGFLLFAPTIKRGFRLDSKVKFFERRANRILPSYYAALVIAIVVGIYVTHKMTIYYVIGMDASVLHPLFLTQDWGLTNLDIDGPLWSLAPEVHIYTAMPFMLWIIRRFGLKNGVSCLFCLFCVASKMLPTASVYLYAIFAFGMWTSWYASTHQSVPWPPARFFATACLVVSGFAYMAGDGQTPLVSIAECVAIFAGLNWVLTQPDGKLATILTNKRILAIGKFSYSLYLTHWIVLSAFASRLHLHSSFATFALMLLVGVPTAVVLSYAFYWVFERPYLEKTRKPKLAIALSSAPIT